MPLCRFRRQYEQLSQSEKRRIIDMMEAVWSASRLARQLGRSGCVDALDRPVIEKTTASSSRPWYASAAIKAQIVPSLGTPRTIRMHLGSRRPLRGLPLTPTHRSLHLEWCHARGNLTAVEWNQVVFSDESRFNLSSNDNRMTIVFVCGDTVVNAVIQPLLCSDTPLPQLV
ncbi:transposable element Tcb1 transposase [Trichonephila clavipes]|nr:transposable element Tcb1 transposase [Trichonephila clavipes]